MEADLLSDEKIELTSGDQNLRQGLKLLASTMGAYCACCAPSTRNAVSANLGDILRELSESDEEFNSARTWFKLRLRRKLEDIELHLRCYSGSFCASQATEEMDAMTKILPDVVDEAQRKKARAEHHPWVCAECASRAEKKSRFVERLRSVSDLNP